MRKAAGWAVIGFLGATVIATVGNESVSLAGNPPTPPVVADKPPTPAVAAHITALGSADYKAREKAGRDLETLGEAVLPDLRRAMSATEDPESRRRLEVLVQRMEQFRLLSAKRVTLSMKDKSAKEVYSEIAKQTGYKIDYQAPTDGKYSFEFDNLPFWMAVDKINDTARLGFQQNGEDHSFQVTGNSGGLTPHVAYAGPYRLVANQIGSQKNVPLTGGQQAFGNRQNETITLNFDIYSEPKNPILSVQQAELISATDNSGASLVPPKVEMPQHFRHHAYYYNGQNYMGHQANGMLQLTRGAKDAVRIRSVKGKMGVTLLSGSVPDVVINDPLKSKDLKLVGRSVEIDYTSMTEANGQYTATLSARKAGAQESPFFDYSWSQNFWSKIELVDDKGERFRCTPTMINYTGTGINMTVVFGMNQPGPFGIGPGGPGGPKGAAPKLGKPVKLVVNEWLQATNEVSFEFKDIPLP